MRLDNGMRFDHCVGLQDRDALDGKVFDANLLTCHDKPLSYEENIRDGIYYLAAIPGPLIPASGDTGYNSLSQAGLVASDFLSFDFATGITGTANPNFSGDPMLFGLGQEFGTGGGGQS